MKTTTQVYRPLGLAMVIAVLAVSLAAPPSAAQTREIPAYVQIRLASVIEYAAAKGDTVKIENMDLNSIVALLDNNNPRLASAAAYVLGEIRDPAAVSALVEALKGDRDHMRRIAAHALGKIGDSRAVMPLIELLCDETQPVAVQTSAIVSLSKIGDPRAKRILTHLNQAPRSWLQQTARVALLKIDTQNDYNLAAAE
jgi:HEAT repeat protein